MRARPLATAAAVAGVAFVAGAIAGSRFARAFVLTATPVVLSRLLDGPLGDDLAAYVKGVMRRTVAVPRDAS